MGIFNLNADMAEGYGPGRWAMMKDFSGWFSRLTLPVAFCR